MKEGYGYTLGDAVMKTDKLSEIMDILIEKIRSIDGVKETTTHIFIE